MDDVTREREKRRKRHEAQSTPQAPSTEQLPVPQQYPPGMPDCDFPENERDKQVAKSWGNTPMERMARLCNEFPSLHRVPGSDPWDVDLLLHWVCTAELSWNALHATRFVLSVFSPCNDWYVVVRKMELGDGVRLAPFNPAAAMRDWDAAHRAAFQRWVSQPMWWSYVGD